MVLGAENHSTGATSAPRGNHRSVPGIESAGRQATPQRWSHLARRGARARAGVRLHSGRRGAAPGTRPQARQVPGPAPQARGRAGVARRKGQLAPRRGRRGLRRKPNLGAARVARAKRNERPPCAAPALRGACLETQSPRGRHTPVRPLGASRRVQDKLRPLSSPAPLFFLFLFVLRPIFLASWTEKTLQQAGKSRHPSTRGSERGSTLYICSLTLLIPSTVRF